MIVEVLINAITLLIQFVFGWINLPGVPETASSAVDTYFNLIFDNLSFLGFFVHVNTLKNVALISIAIITFSRLYKVCLWIYHKLPISSS